MELKDIIIAIIALILAVFVINVTWAIAFFAIKVVAFLIVAFIVYLLLKKIL